MPKAKASHSLARQWELLKLLPPKGPGITAKDLAEKLSHAGFEISKRTIERDLQDLSLVFPLMCNDKGMPYGWHSMPGASSDLPAIGLSDALSLHVVEDLVRPLLPASVLAALEPRFPQARQKLAALASESPAARWTEKVRQVAPTLPLLPPRITEGVLETVQAALLADEQLDALYQRPGADAPARQRLHPLALVQRGPITYLIATAFRYDELRLYAVHRIYEAMRTGEPARRPPDFDLNGYIASGALQFGSGEIIRLKAQVADELARILAETPLSDDMQLVSDGNGKALSATVPDTWQLRWWVLSQGEAIEVLAPTELREEIAATLSAALERYHDPEGRQF
jgi:predicted DNA-binding transcriptional regulator YafY